MQYGVVGNGSTQTKIISGGSVTEVTISSLILFTTYSIQVAAVNNIGIGVYSDVIVYPESKSILVGSATCNNFFGIDYIHSCTNLYLFCYRCIPQPQ